MTAPDIPLEIEELFDSISRVEYSSPRDRGQYVSIRGLGQHFDRDIDGLGLVCLRAFGG